MNLIKIDESKKKELVPGGNVQFIHSDNMTFAYWTFKAGSQFPEHSHSHEQVVNVIAGELDLSVDNEIKRLGPGEIVIIPSNAVHFAKAVTDCRIIDVFYPIREDYR